MNSEDDPAKKRNRGMLFWTGQDRGEPIKPPEYKRPVFGTETNAANLFHLQIVYVGEDIVLPLEAEKTDETPPAEE